MTMAWLTCRTNFDCDNLESFLTGLGGGGKFRGKMEKGVENPYSCLVLAGARSMDQRRDALQVCHMQTCCCMIYVLVCTVRVLLLLRVCRLMAQHSAAQQSTAQHCSMLCGH